MQIIAKDFNLRYTIESGQPLTFFGDYSFSNNETFLSYPAEHGKINVFGEQKGKDCILSIESESYSKSELKKEIEERFGLKDNIKYIYKKIATDKFMEEAIKNFYGMRVTKNSIWEATLSFIVSQFNNIKRIRKIMLCFVERFGKGSFPGPDAIVGKEITVCGAGFRGKYILEIARLYDKELFDSYALLPYEEAKKELMQYKGIGDKVADCILLMGYKKLEAFPIDTWVKKALTMEYGLRGKSIKKMHEFATHRWDGFAGYAQQYIFWHGRNYFRKDLKEHI
ncbi:MAG: hypothetical protein RXP92_02745 [Candidatus Micrarchaeota archaeon]